MSFPAPLRAIGVLHLMQATCSKTHCGLAKESPANDGGPLEFFYDPRNMVSCYKDMSHAKSRGSFCNPCLEAATMRALVDTAL